MASAASHTTRPTLTELFTPKLVTLLREGYGWADLRADAIAGLTAITVGVTLGAFLVLHRLAEAVEIEGGGQLIAEDQADTKGPERTAYDPHRLEGDVMVYRISGAFFFGASAAVSSVLDRIGEHPRIFVLDFTDVPLVDSTAAKGLEGFGHKLTRSGAQVWFAGVRRSMRRTLLMAGLRPPLVRYAAAPEYAVALARAGRRPDVR